MFGCTSLFHDGPERSLLLHFDAHQLLPVAVSSYFPMGNPGFPFGKKPRARKHLRGHSHRFHVRLSIRGLPLIR